MDQRELLSPRRRAAPRSRGKEGTGEQGNKTGRGMGWVGKALIITRS